ncbi:MAG: Gfo/Idh/MocA family oxidoreductase [Candidatus Bathyarchaeia archaeon]
MPGRLSIKEVARSRYLTLFQIWLNSNSRIKAVWGRNAAKVKTFAKANGVKPYPTLQSILDDESVDVVDVCTPSDTHAKFTIESLAAGKHVLVEKPMG